MEKMVGKWGFLPFFAGDVEGFSIEELATRDCWFPGGTVDGVWEWKGQVIAEGDCAYGKFYKQKACFISMDWFPDFANWRRSRYVPSEAELAVLDTLKEHQSLLSKELKKLCGYAKTPRQPRATNPLERMAVRAMKGSIKTERTGLPSFDGTLTRLQMGARVMIADFEYQYDKQGRRYGWGVARYCTPEDFFGAERLQCPRSPEASRARIKAHLQSLLPWATESQIDNILG